MEENRRQYLIRNVTDLCSCNGVCKPEFRLTEIKASMRFWWRALNYYDNCKEMKNEEDRIFGNADKIKSPIAMRILNNKNEFSGVFKEHKVGWNYRNKEASNVKCFCSDKKVNIEISVHKRKINKNMPL